MTLPRSLRPFGCLLALAIVPAVTQAAPEEPNPVPVSARGIPVDFSALLQNWIFADSTRSTGSRFDFRIRRAELGFEGYATPEIHWFVRVDPAQLLPESTASGEDGRLLRDLGVGYSPLEGIEIAVGRVLRVPTTAEGLDPSSELLFPERALTSRLYGYRREPGLQLSYTTQYWRFAAMISNGQQFPEETESSSPVPKDVSLRADLFPPSKTSTAGVFINLADFDMQKRGRVGVNVRTHVDAADFRFEVVRANEGDEVTTAGFADFAYTFFDRLQPVARVELLRGSFSAGNVGTLGLNWKFLKDRAKAQLSASFLQNVSGANGSYRLSDGAQGGLVVLNLQVAI